MAENEPEKPSVWSSLHTFMGRFTATAGAFSVVLLGITYYANDSQGVEDWVREKAGTEEAAIAAAEAIDRAATEAERNIEAQRDRADLRAETQAAQIANLEKGMGEGLEAISQKVTALSEAVTLATKTLAENAETLSGLIARQEAASADAAREREPCLAFDPSGNSATDAAPGGTIRVSFTVVKLRSCGMPAHGVWIRATDDEIHACENNSMTGPTGIMLEIPARPERQRIVFTCQIPDNEGIRPGPAHVWLVPHYQGAPFAQNAPSPELEFEILPR